MMNQPNFLIVGAAKAGTTSLYQYLKQHPEIFMSSKKELNFFTFNGEQYDSDGTIDEAGKKRFDSLKSISVTDVATYESQFERATKAKAIGEASPLYLYSPRVPQRIYQYKPDMKLIAILRDPVERAYSHYMYFVGRGQESVSNFVRVIEEEDIDTNNIWFGARHYIRMGFYHRQLQRYYELLEPENIKIYFYEDFVRNLQEIVQDIFQFLGVRKDFAVKTELQYNQTLVPKNKILHTLLTSQFLFQKSIKKRLPAKLIRFKNNLKYRNLVNKKPPLSHDARKILISIYEEDILKLQKLTGKNLSHWLSIDF